MSNIIIAPEHQSSPKPTELNKAIREAAEEIHAGKFTAPLEENVFGKKEDEFWNAGITTTLASHPRVQEAIAKLQTRIVDKTSTEYLEAAEQLHELNARAAAGDKWEGQERWEGKTNREMRVVNLLEPRHFIDKLLRANVSAAVIPRLESDWKANPSTGVLEMVEVERSDAKICLGHRVVRGCVGVFANLRGEYRYINKLQVPIGPEWTVMRFDEYGVPTTEEYHGWRSAVLSLITQGALSEREADRAFGKVVENPASSFYREQLADHRNRRHA